MPTVKGIGQGQRVNQLLRLKPFVPSFLRTLPMHGLGAPSYQPFLQVNVSDTVEITLWSYVSMVDPTGAQKVEDLIKSKMHFPVIERFLGEALNDEVAVEDVSELFGRGIVTLRPDSKFSENVMVWDVAAIYYFEIQDLDNAILFASKCYEKIGHTAKLDPVSKLWKAHYAGILGMAYLQKARDLAEQNGESAEIRKFLNKSQTYYEEDLACKPDAVHDYGHYWESLYRQGKYDQVVRSIRRALFFYKENPPAGIYFYAWRILMNIVVHEALLDKNVVGEAIRIYELMEEVIPSLEEGQVSDYKNLTPLTGIVYYYADNFDKARALILKKENWETDELMLYYMALICFKTGEKDEAKRLVEKLEEINPTYKKLQKLKDVVFEKKPAKAEKRVEVSKETPKTQSTPAILLVDAPLEAVAASFEIGFDEFKSHVLGPDSSNIARIFTDDKRARHFISDGISAVISDYVSLLDSDGIGALGAVFASNRTPLPLYDSKIAEVFNILGITSIDVGFNESLFDVRIYLAGEQFEGRYFKISSSGFSFGVKGLREISLLVEAAILEGMVAITSGGAGYGYLSEALEKREGESSPAINWKELGKVAKAEREKRIEEERAIKAAEIARAEEERKRMEIEARRQEKSREAEFFSENLAAYIEVMLAYDEVDLDFSSFSEKTEEMISKFLICLRNFRAFDIAKSGFSFEIPEYDPLSKIIRRGKMYGPDSAAKILREKGVREETLRDLGFYADKSPYLGVYELEYEFEGNLGVLTVTLDGKTGNLRVLCGDEEALDQFLNSSIQRTILDRLVYFTVRSINDTFVFDSQPSYVSTAREVDMLPKIISLYAEFNSGLSPSQKIASVSQAVISIAEELEIARIASEGLLREPLYVRRKDGTMRRVKTTDFDYEKSMRLSGEEKFVKIGAGYTRSRLPLGKKITPEKRDRVKDEPYFYVLQFFPGRRVESLPSFEALSLSKLFGNDSEEYRRLSLMPYEMSQDIRKAYFEDSPNRLESDLQPKLMVYAVASLDDDESVLYIPRNVSGDTIEDVFGKLNKRQGHITFLQKFLAGLGDEKFIEGLDPKDRKRVREFGIKRRTVVVMRTNVGYVQGKFISHRRFMDLQRGLGLGKKEDEPEQ